MNIIRYIAALLLALVAFLAGLWVANNDLAIGKFFGQFGELVLPVIIFVVVIVVLVLLLRMVATGQVPFQGRVRAAIDHSRNNRNNT